MALVVTIQGSRRAGRAEDRGMDVRRTPGGLEAGPSQVRYQKRPFPQQGICLNGGEGAVDGASLLSV